MRNFRELDVWKNALVIARKTYSVTALLPKEEQFGLKSQMNRAAISISSNIAEGCSRNSDKDFKRFLEIAQGSAFELESQILVMQELQLSTETSLNSIEELVNLIHQEQRMLNAFITKIKDRVN